jgi:hypothetical protein
MTGAVLGSGSAADGQDDEAREVTTRRSHKFFTIWHNEPNSLRTPLTRRFMQSWRAELLQQSAHPQGPG